MAIDKITGAPNNNVASWSWNETEKFSPNPMKKETNPFNNMGTSVGKPKEKYRDRPHGNPDMLATVLTNLVNKVNQIVDIVNTLPVHPHTPDTHSHTAAETPYMPNATVMHTHGITRKGGKLQRGGASSILTPVSTPTPNPNFRQGTQRTNRTRPVITSRDDMKKLLISQIKNLQ